VLARDGHACAECGSTDRPNVDHILAKSKGGTDALSNLQVLCRRCHLRKTGRESGVGIESKVRLRDLP
jgi:5-methylcytosine-specific restriction endonuclease McrA